MRTSYRIDRRRLSHWLIDHDMTQTELAGKVGCCANTLNGTLREERNCRMDLLLNLSDATGLDVRELVEEVPAPGVPR